jgi:hypothetical protein
MNSEQAIRESLLALAQREIDLGSSAELEHLAASLGRSLATYPQQFEDSEWRGDVALPFPALAVLLADSHRLRQENKRLRGVESEHEELVGVWERAVDAFGNPREKDRNKYNQDAMDALGLNTRRPRSKYEFIYDEFQELKAAGYKTQDAYGALAARHKVGADAIRKGIKRERQKHSPR